jgi:predicted transcriptional regulator
MDHESKKQKLLSLTTDIVSAFAGNNTVAIGDLPGLISSVFAALRTTGQAEEKASEPPTPAVPIRKSVSPDFLICLEDGKKLKMLKRHLKTRYHMSPEEYRQRWGLPRTTRWWPRPTPSSARAWPSGSGWAGGLRRCRHHLNRPLPPRNRLAGRRAPSAEQAHQPAERSFWLCWCVGLFPDFLARTGAFGQEVTPREKPERPLVRGFRPAASR